MKTKIIAFAGGKGCGKTTSMNFLHGYQLRAYQVIENFAISDKGELVVKTEIEQDGKTEVADTYMDINRKDLEFIEWAMYNVWPFVKKYSFADPLKEMAVGLFGLKNEQVYGSLEHKKQVVPHLRWENMPGILTHEVAEEEWGYLRLNYDSKAMQKEFSKINLTYHTAGPMTVRDFLQHFGTDICRKIHPNIWVDRCLQDIQLEQPLLAVIDDCRFPNEVEAIQEIGGKVIGLTRSTEGVDHHSSEQEIKKSWDTIDHVIDNQDMTIHETCAAIIEAIEGFGWLQEEIVADSKNTRKKKIHKIKED